MIICGAGRRNSYPIIIGINNINIINDYFSSSEKALIVIDNKVNKDFITKIEELGFNTFVYYTDGEKSKTFECYLELNNILIENSFSRNDLIISVGGGATTDLAGFVASTFKRGINLINIPSTTLAMVDAAIGSKNAIDYQGIKNVIGSFYDPSLVIIDLDLLDTLDKETFNAGLVEAIKCGLINDKDLFNIFVNNDIKTIQDYKNNDVLIEIIRRAVEVKTKIVEEDYYDKDVRKYLNFGHTFSHALESYSNYEITHGNSVAFGMLKVIDDKLKPLLKKALDNINIKYDYDINNNELIKYIINDKKAFGDYIDIVTVESIGQAKLIKKKISELV